MDTTQEGPTTPLRAARLEQDRTQQEVAYHAGVTPITLSKLERGKGKANMSTRKAVAKTLGCTVEELWPPPSTRSARKVRG